MDYGQEGLLGTIEALDRAGVRHVGAGRDSNEACQPLILESQGLKVGILGRCSWMCTPSVMPTGDQPGVGLFRPGRGGPKGEGIEEAGRPDRSSLALGNRELQIPFAFTAENSPDPRWRRG